MARKIPSDFRLYRLYNDTKTKNNPLNVLIFDWDVSSGDYCNFASFIKPYAQELLGTIASTHTVGSLFTGEEKKGQYYIKKDGEDETFIYYSYYLYDGRSYRGLSVQWLQSLELEQVEAGGNGYFTCNPNLVIFIKDINSNKYYLSTWQAQGGDSSPIIISPRSGDFNKISFYTDDTVQVTSGSTGSVSILAGGGDLWGFTPFDLRDYTKLCRWIEDNIAPYDLKDPDPNIDDSDGDKNRTPTDDIGGNTIGDDDLPTLSVMDTGLVTLYNPTVGQLQDLGHYLWSDLFSVDTFKKLFSDPFDTLLGLSILPVKPTISGSHNIYFGNIDTGVSSNVVANQFLKVDMGSLTLSETYASAFDYAPSTQVDIYLPFIGSHGLNTNDVMGSTLHLIYKFDLLSGGCIAELFINHTSQGNKKRGMKYNPNMGLAYTFSGQCSCPIPLTSNNYNGMIQSVIQSVGSVAKGIGTSVATGNPALGVADVAVSATTIGLQANTPTVQRSGSIGSSNALLSCLTPYLSVQRAHVCKPGHFYSKRGLPSQVYVDNISSVGNGNFFQIADCADLHAKGASDTELAEIKSILTSGAVW